MIIFLSFSSVLIEEINSSGFAKTSSAAGDGGVSGLFLKKKIAKRVKNPEIPAYNASALTIFSSNYSFVSLPDTKIIGIVNPTAAPNAYAATDRVSAVILSFAPNHTFASLAG